MTQTISVVFQPLGSIGKEYYHETLVYDDGSGNLQYATAYAPNSPSAGALVSAAVEANAGSSTAYGNIEVQTGNVSDLSNASFDRMFATNGPPNPSQILSSGDNLSAQWTAIVSTYNNIAAENIPYSPLTQNSNSTANTALTAAGVTTPFVDDLHTCPTRSRSLVSRVSMRRPMTSLVLLVCKVVAQTPASRELRR